MAEALLRSKAGERPIVVDSAGSQPATVVLDAIRALAELGIEITGQQSKHFDRFCDDHFDYVVTVNDPRACYVTLAATGNQLDVQFHRVAYDVEAAAQAIEASEMPHEYAQMLRVGRD